MSELPGSIRRNPSLDRWISIAPEGTVTVRSGKVELGQGIHTALTLIAADELDVHPERIRVIGADTAASPDELITAGSMSVQDGGAAVRQACAWARRVLLERAAEALQTTPETLTIEDGVIRLAGGNPSVDFATLAAGRPFELDMDTHAPEKPAAQYRWIGRGMRRIDLPPKARGEPAFVHDLGLPGCRQARARDLLHARVIRPARQGARIESADTHGIESLPGVHAVVRDGAFLAVLARREADAVRAAERGRQLIRTHPPDPLPADLQQHLKAHERWALPVVDGTPMEEAVPSRTPPDPSATVHEASYTRPFQMHGAIGPSAALAEWQEGRLTVHTHSQGVGPLRLTMATTLGLHPRDVRVIHSEGAGCYGHNGADDAALDAALAARSAPGHPVLLKWTRGDEHRYEPYAPAMRCQLAATLDRDGRVSWWSHDVWSYTHLGRPIPNRDDFVALRAAWELAEPFETPPVRPALGRHVGVHRNADPLYNFPRRRIIKRLSAPSPLRTSSTRSLGAFANVFAIESFVHELALAADTDPITFRLAHLDDVRARTVIEHLRSLTADTPQARASGGTLRGRGMGFAQYKNQQTYAAVMAQVAVDEATATIRLEQLWIAADAGRVVDPDGLINQLEGGAIQAASWTLKEAVTFDREAVTSDDWERYPILRFDEVPEVATELVETPDTPSVGAGEATQGPTAGAIANAVFAATELRIRDLPITAERLRAAASA